jgi:uncharacterized repeat protein (TIGR01451 family)
MLRKLIAPTVLAVSVVWFASPAPAQRSPDDSAADTSLSGRIDKLGRTLMGGIFATQPDAREKTPGHTTPNSNINRAGTTTGTWRTGTGTGADRSAALPVGNARAAAPGRGSATQLTPRYTPRYQWNKPVEREAAPSVRHDATVASQSGGAPSRPLHERLIGVRRSVFATDGSAGTASRGIQNTPGDRQPTPAPHTTVIRHGTAGAGFHNTTHQNTTSQNIVGGPQPTLAPRKTVIRNGTIEPGIQNTGIQNTADHQQPTLAPRARVARRGTVVRRPAVEYGVESSISDGNLGQPTPAGAATVGSDTPDQQPGQVLPGQVLFVQQSPVLSVQTVGPRRIAVGKESAYAVVIENAGQVAADDVVVTIDLPDWADVLGAEASIGATRSDRSETGAKQFCWKVGPLGAKGREKILLRIVPRKNRPIELAVRWNYTPVASHTVIEVQEPKLAMRLNGPREVFFGKKEKFQLEISNTGNGAAESVAITLMPITQGDGLPSTHKLGTLGAGKKKVIEIELTARQPGNLTVAVDLRSDGEVRAKLNEKILVRKAEIAIDVVGPKVQYIGTVASYRIRVKNSGNAAARHVNVTATIPAEAKYISSNHGGKLEPGRPKAVWSIEGLEPGAEKVLQLQCRLVQAGFSRLEIVSTVDNQIAASTATATKVEAMADLSLEVTDPAGPVPVGQDAVFEVRIRNRGTKRAENVEVVVYFSRGIEPVTVEGNPYNIGPGQVVFDTIGSLPAGKDVVLKITARADTPGNHMFRAEVFCKPLGTKLLGEETTHFYDGNLGTGPTTTEGRSGGRDASATRGNDLRSATQPRAAVPRH